MTPDPSEGGQPKTETPTSADADPGSTGGQSVDGKQEPTRLDDHGRQTGRPEGMTPAEEIDWRGWLLVGAVVVSFLVIPAMILYLPAAQGFIESLGVSMRQAYLALPMVPAIILGIIAVWAAVQTQGRAK